MSMIGEDAAAAGYNLVPETGEEGRVRWGAREFNRTRDYIARVLAQIPVGKAAYRAASGITSSTSVPSNATGTDGDVHFKTL